jgi:hypothetical protein
MEKLPFKETIQNDYRVRTFLENVEFSDLKWHTDEQDRIVIPLHETDWKIQLDNELPITMIKGKKYFIPEGIYHRVIKGNGDLKVKIFFK